IERGDEPLSGQLDRDFMAPILTHAERIGVSWMWGSTVKSITRAGAAFRVDLGDLAIDADFVLNAAGRTAGIEQLDLARAQVEGGEHGIDVDEFLCSRTNPRVYAAGDAHGEFQLSPVASYEGRVIARNILAPGSRAVDYGTFPRAVFTTPPIATVGLTE